MQNKQWKIVDDKLPMDESPVEWKDDSTIAITVHNSLMEVQLYLSSRPIFTYQLSILHVPESEPAISHRHNQGSCL